MTPVEAVAIAPLAIIDGLIVALAWTMDRRQ